MDEAAKTRGADMRVDPTLCSKDFEHALSILKSEPEAIMPSRRQILYIRYFNLFIGIILIHAVSESFVDFSDGLNVGIGVLEDILLF
jgi:hypothetical protein